jgi:hypothetical protein
MTYEISVPSHSNTRGQYPFQSQIEYEIQPNLLNTHTFLPSPTQGSFKTHTDTTKIQYPSNSHNDTEDPRSKPSPSEYDSKIRHSHIQDPILQSTIPKILVLFVSSRISWILFTSLGGKESSGVFLFSLTLPLLKEVP